MEINAYDPSKIKKVEMAKVHPNSWNPKVKNHKKVESIERSIRKHGFKQPIQVRVHPTLTDEWEIIDGEQRYTAMDNLGAEFIYIYDNGVVDDTDAQNETLWWQVQVPFERVELAKLVTHLDALEMEMPYTATEIVEFRGMSDKGKDDKDGDPKDQNRLSIKLSPDQYIIVRQAIDRCKEINECEDARAIELICADFLASY